MKSSCLQISRIEVSRSSAVKLTTQKKLFCGITLIDIIHIYNTSIPRISGSRESCDQMTGLRTEKIESCLEIKMLFAYDTNRGSSI